MKKIIYILIFVLIAFGIVHTGIKIKQEMEREAMTKMITREYEEAKRIITEELKNASKELKR